MRTFEYLAVAIVWLYIAHRYAVSGGHNVVMTCAGIAGTLSLIWATLEAWRDRK